MLLTRETLASLKWNFCVRAPLGWFSLTVCVANCALLSGAASLQPLSDPWAGTRSHVQSAADQLLLLLWGCLLGNALGCPSSHLTRCQGPLGFEEWDNKKQWSLGKQP